MNKNGFSLLFVHPPNVVETDNGHKEQKADERVPTFPFITGCSVSTACLQEDGLHFEKRAIPSTQLAIPTTNHHTTLICSKLFKMHITALSTLLFTASVFATPVKQTVHARTAPSTDLVIRGVSRRLLSKRERH